MEFGLLGVCKREPKTKIVLNREIRKGKQAAGTV
jgi:hypothetical protein